MKANAIKIEDFLSLNNVQFIIPVYQRNYNWSIRECKQLFDNIIEVGVNKHMTSHFIGSIVYVHNDTYVSGNVKKLTIIDGQQRLTTLTLIYLVLCQLGEKLNKKNLANEISETYLINKFLGEEEKLKLRAIENNDKALKYLLQNKNSIDFSDFSQLINNFNYYRDRITEDNYQFIRDGLSKLMFVEISLDRDKDEPQRIFESLNSTGLDLSQADLIRNYILIGLEPQDQNKIYHTYWEVIENLAKDESSNVSKVSDYIRDYLTIKNKKIPNKSKVYIEFKTKYPISSINKLEDILKEMKNLVRYYNKLINPKNETDKDIQLQLEYINRLEINVAFPFLVKVYDDYASSIIDKPTFLNILALIQSFVWRRFILGLPTNALNKIFMSLYDKTDQEDYLYSIQKFLIQKSGIQRFPKDMEVRDILRIKDVYNIQAKNRTYFMERLENFNNTERVLIQNNPDITIEHIFPQKPDPKWKTDLNDKEYSFIQENYINTIGNLTLSGNNSKLSNKPFKEKRDLKGAGYQYSRLWMNKYLTQLDRWGKYEIEERYNQMCKRFFQIWEYPQIEVKINQGMTASNIFDIDDPTHKKLEYAILFDQKIDYNEVTKLYIEVFKQLFDMQPETFFSSELGEQISLTKNPNTIRHPSKINDTYFIETNIDSNNKFNRIKQALTIFDLEDELLIKYQE